MGLAMVSGGGLVMVEKFASLRLSVLPEDDALGVFLWSLGPCSYRAVTGGIGPSVCIFRSYSHRRRAIM